MNKIYKLVWSKARNAWVVASEIAKGYGKSSSPKGNGKRLKSLVLMALLGCFMTGLGQGVQADGTNSYSWGSGSEATGDQSVAAGDSAKALGEGSTAVGQGAQAIERFSTALGQNAHAEKDNSTALGNGAQAQADYSTAVGFRAQATGESSTALGYDAHAEKYFSTAVGFRAQATGESSTALGDDAHAEKYFSTAVGFRAQASGINSTALGNGAKAEKDYSTALGNDAQASGINSTALGNGAKAEKDYSTALGNAAHASGISSMALGSGAKAEKDSSTALGNDAHASGLNSTALGKGAKAEKDYSTALGNAAHASGLNSTALGKGAQAEKDFSTALGKEAQALVEGSVALGSDSIASIDKGVNGYDPLAGKASTENSAIWKATQAALSVGSTVDGNNLITRQITGVAAGTQDTDAVNVAQLKALNTKVDKGAVHYFSVKSGKPANTDRTNWNNDGATGEDAVAIGYGAQAKGNWSTALGKGAQAQGNVSTALGYNAQAQGNSSMALGYEAIAKVAGSVALGRDSIASIDKGVFGYDPFTGQASTETSAIWQATHAAFSVGSTSDKSDLRTRQITGVAAGTQDTDAVNVAQLKALERKLIKVLPEVVGDQNTGVVVEKNPKENTPTSSTGETTSPTGVMAPSADVTAPSADVTAPPTSGTALPTGGTVRSADVTAQPTGVTAQPTGVTTTTTAPTDEGKTVYKVKLDKKVDVGNISIDGTENKETITIGKGDNNVTVDTTGLTIANGPSVTKTGINANKNKITNVGDGTISEDSTDAVNGKQLYGVKQDVDKNTTNINNLQNNISDMGMTLGELDTRVNKVGADAAALAGLHPLEYDEDDKWDFAASMGNYNGANAFALGAFYRPNERAMISLGGTLGGKENMINIGLSMKAGQGTDGKTYTSRAAMAKEIKVLKEKDETREALMQKMIAHETEKDAEIKALKEKDAQREEQIRKLTEMIVKLQHKA